MKISELIENDMALDEGAVWVLKGHEKFEYSDGAASEKYLQQVFNRANDLSSGSFELESYIKDWPSEYHLTRKRAQLLSGFQFDRKMSVLEVGCGCGAITRFLGENFDQVVSVEGSRSRARLARLRTKDLDNVSIICAPFQDIKFSKKFDIIFCIGVFEYSGAFVAGDDPYDEALRYFKKMLNPNGLLVIAIENQFGLKYFSCAREDHIGTMFEGLEGYHRRPLKVRTFGKGELQTRMQRYFSNIEFYYPYPDYKLPECVLSTPFVESGRAGELISQMKSRDYSGPMHRYWDEAATTLELDRNGMLPFFANSFIVVAGLNEVNRMRFPQLGILYSPNRQPRFTTLTRVLGVANGEMRVVKEQISGSPEAESGRLILRQQQGPWIDSLSLQTQLQIKARMGRLSLADVFAPCKPWLAKLQSEGINRGGQCFLDGDHIDSIWSNIYMSGDECQIIDREYVWRDPLSLNVVVIRAIYNFLEKLDYSLPIADALKARSGRSLIANIATTIGVRLTAEDFDQFIDVETEFQWEVFGISKRDHAVYLRWYMTDRNSLKAFIQLKKSVATIVKRIGARVGFAD